MSVVHMPGPDGRDVARALSRLLKLAAGDSLVGVAVSFRTSDGAEQSFLAGCYVRDPSAALKASLRQSWAITQSQDLPKPPRRKRRPAR